MISPTEAIAVLGILKQAKVRKKFETKIVGESLFNDGVVIFAIIVQGLTVSALARRLIGTDAVKGQQEPDPMTH